MKMFTTTLSAVAVVPALAIGLMAATPADAQNRYRDQDRRDDTAKNAILGAVVGGLAGAIIGNGDGSYVAGGALAGAALGASASNRGSGCEYFRGGRCYRNLGHWEREHGINSRDYGYGYSYDGYGYDSHYNPGRQDRRYDRRDDRRDSRRDNRRDDRRDYRYERRW